jgi:hypothetical protein
VDSRNGIKNTTYDFFFFVRPRQSVYLRTDEDWFLLGSKTMLRMREYERACERICV